MELERGTTRVFACPVCRKDTPQRVRGRRGDIYALVCTYCAGGSLVRRDELRLHQVRWEEELRHILDNLHESGDPGERK